MKEKLKQQLKPLYAHLLESVASQNYEDKVCFCVQWGMNFPQEPNQGILFVGRATNGWVAQGEDLETLFGDSDSSIFAREDQMQWVENAEGNREGYNSNRSAFWRVIKQVAQHYYSDNWSSYIAWSNVCKVAPQGGNPNDSLYYAQLEDCKKILKTEIEVLSPKFVIFLTGENWAVDFLRFLNGGRDTHSIQTENWCDYECKVYQFDDKITYIRSEHPERKPESNHVSCLVDLIEKYK